MKSFVAFLCLSLALASSAFACGRGRGGCGSSCGSCDSSYSSCGDCGYVSQGDCGCGCGMNGCGCGGSGGCGLVPNIQAPLAPPPAPATPQAQPPLQTPQFQKAAPPTKNVPAPVVPDIQVPTTGTFILRVPSDAKVWVNGYQTKQTGTSRTYISRLVPNYDYDFEVVVRSGGRQFRGTIALTAGDTKQYSVGTDVPQNTMYATNP